jgi:hypothetical protein
MTLLKVIFWQGRNKIAYSLSKLVNSSGSSYVEGEDDIGRMRGGKRAFGSVHRVRIPGDCDLAVFCGLWQLTKTKGCNDPKTFEY